jgi:hypothetical protein
MFGTLEIFLLVFFLWFLVINTIKRYRGEVDEMVEKRIEQEKTEVVVCRSECIDNQIYVWDIRDDSFIGQGKSVEDIIELFIHKYPNTSMRFDVKQK